MSEEIPSGEAKKPWQSKTLWINLILALFSFFPGPLAEVATPENLGTLFAVINTVLRFATKTGIAIN